MTDFAQAVGRGIPRRPTGTRLVALGLIAGGLVLAAAPMAYVLWPQPVPVTLDAPSLPISVGGVTFNVPPAAVRVAVQRRPGTQPRIDLVFLWPSLTPPDPAIKVTPTAAPSLRERIFVTVAASDTALPPAERLKVIYPRYTAGQPAVRPDGLTARTFRAGTPYQGEELIYDASAPERLLLRCTHTIGATPGMCLHERRIATADVTARFPRDWLADWRVVADGIDRLIASLRPSGS
jgi:hypothetical protein